MSDTIDPKPGRPLNLEREDFDFRTVEDREIVACCLWEYARESSTFKNLADCHYIQSVRRRERLANKPVEPWELDRAALLERDLEEAGFEFGPIHEAFLASDHFGLEIYFYLTTYVGTEAEPWQKLSQQGRDLLVESVGKSWTIRPFTPAFVTDLELLWNAHSGPLLDARAAKRSERAERELTALYEETSPCRVAEDDASQPSRKTVAAFTIDFARFTDTEIVEAFSRWVKENRPVEWKKPLNIIPRAPRRGIKLLDYRVALERLAVLRLLHWHSPEDLNIRYPDVWETFRRDETHFRVEANKARAVFRRLFPFLPKSELPLSSVAYEDRDFGYNQDPIACGT